MDTLSHDAETYQTGLEHLLAHTDTRETRSKLRGYFQRLLEFVEASADKLGAVEALQDETLWTQHEGWTFDDPLTRPSFLRKLLGSVDVLLQVQWATGQREADLTERDGLFRAVRVRQINRTKLCAAQTKPRRENLSFLAQEASLLLFGGYYRQRNSK